MELYLLAVYKIDKNEKQLIYEDFGYWSQFNGFVDQRTTKILARRRRNLRGKVLTASIVLRNNDSMNRMDDMR